MNQNAQANSKTIEKFDEVLSALMNVPEVGEKYDQQHSDTHMRAYLCVKDLKTDAAEQNAQAAVSSHQFSLPLNDAQKTVLGMIGGLKYQHLIYEQDVGAFNQAVQGSNDALLQYLLTELSNHKDQGSKLSPSQRISVAMMEMKYVLDKLIAQHDQKDLRGHAGVAFQTAAIEPSDQLPRERG